MSDTFKAAIGRKVVSSASAEELGKIARLVVDVDTKKVTALVLGKGRKARIVAWEALSGFGPDAIMVNHESGLREATDEMDHRAVDGALELIGKRALTELGNEIGTIDDVEFDPVDGTLEVLLVGKQKHPATTLLGNGSYAAVLDRSTDPA